METLSSIIPREQILGSKLAGETALTGLSCDSRDVKGKLFFALRGHSVDGHQFAQAALENGASGVVVEDSELFSKLPNVVRVADTRRILGLAASRWFGRPSESFFLVGITGTNGKSTTTFLLRRLWEELKLKSAILGTIEYLIGDKVLESKLTTPDPLQLQSLFSSMRDAQVSSAAIEVSSIALDQARVWGSQFDAAVFTNLTQDHLDYHGDIENYYHAKRRLFRDYGVLNAVMNIDDRFGVRLTDETSAPHVWTFSLENPKADLFLADISLERFGSTGRLICQGEEELEFRAPLVGKHNLYNFLGALGVLKSQGYTAAEALEGLGTFTGAPGRLDKVERLDGPAVYVDYAHTDDALQNVLRILNELKGDGKIITVFGCGGDRDRGKRPRMAAVASALSDITVATSDNPRTENPDAILDDVEPGIDRGATQYHRQVNRRLAIYLALDLAKENDIVLIAGKGHETYQIVGKETLPFDDKQVVRDYYATQTE